MAVYLGSRRCGQVMTTRSITLTQTDDATATEADVLAGKTYFAQNALHTGAIPPLDAQTITPGTSDQIIAAGQYLAGAQTIKGDIHLQPENIAQGVTLFGVVGALKAQIKGATGSVTLAKGVTSFSIAGLDFDPVVVCILYSSTRYFCIDLQDVGISANGGCSAFSHEDGGYTVTLSTVSMSSRTYTWYAIGL